MKWLVIIDDSEAMRGYSPKIKRYIEAKNIVEARRKVAKLIGLSVKDFQREEPGEYYIDGFGTVEIYPLRKGVKKDNEVFGGMF